MESETAKRLIEDYLPIEAISAEASREKSVRKGHISTLHLWWARRPLVACRAAVYGALVPASRFVPEGATDEKKKSLGRANAAKFVKRLCRYPSDSKPEEKIDIDRAIKEAQRHILEAHAERLTNETGKKVTVEDIVNGRAPRPKVLDMFAGGGSIPLEALRLGCDAYALDLNPVAHIIELCTLVYPQRYGKPNPTARGMTGPTGKDGQSTWGGLAAEVLYWGEWVFNKVKAEIGDLYPLIPDPEFRGKKTILQADWIKEHSTGDVPPGYLVPVAYLWTRTVTCKNPPCRATVPLVKQSWLCKKPGRYVALKMIAPKDKKKVRFALVEAHSESQLGFDPSGFSKGGNATCPFCGAVADDDYVKQEGIRNCIGEQLMAVVAAPRGRSGKVYLDSSQVSFEEVLDGPDIARRLKDLQDQKALSVPDEPIIDDGKASFWCNLYGVAEWGHIFSPRQNLALLTFCSGVRDAIDQMRFEGLSTDLTTVNAAYLGLMVSRMANFSSSLCLWNSTGGRGVVHSFSHQAVPHTWDYPESNPLYEEAAGWPASMDAFKAVTSNLPPDLPAHVVRGDARSIALEKESMDAVVTDPPYYDNISYADLSDFFYVWLKRAIGTAFSEHFAGRGTPKKPEIVSDHARHNGNKSLARSWFEEQLGLAFSAAQRALKPGGILACVYAHKTTLGWTTLVDALRQAGFEVSEAWPLATERPGGMKVDKAMLASSIFLIARKRAGAAIGNYEDTVKPELERIVRERVGTLWAMGISGADLVIASVGAGLRAFTRYARVEYSNGEDVPAERFLSEVETVVLETILARLSKEVGGNGGKHSLAGLDPTTRFYILWRYTYRAADLDAGEAIIFANGTHVELDGFHGLSTGSHNLVEKKKGKYRLLDFSERGDDKHIGLPADDGQSAPLVDALHRMLWLLEKRPTQLSEFLRDSQVNREQLRLVAQALAGPALKGGELADVSPSAELSVLAKLMANWQSVVEDAAMTAGEKDDRKIGQKRFDI